MKDQELKLLKLKIEINLDDLRNANYCRIADKIDSLWGSTELSHYFNSLQFDDRGDRQGFPKEVFKAIHNLQDLHFTVIDHKPEPWLPSVFVCR